MPSATLNHSNDLIKAQDEILEDHRCNNSLMGNVTGANSENKKEMGT